MATYPRTCGRGSTTEEGLTHHTAAVLPIWVASLRLSVIRFSRCLSLISSNRLEVYQD